MNKKHKHTLMRYFCDVGCCQKSDMDRLLKLPAFVSKLPPETNGTGLYREDQVRTWFNQCLKEVFVLEHSLTADGCQNYYGYRH